MSRLSSLSGVAELRAKQLLCFLCLTSLYDPKRETPAAPSRLHAVPLSRFERMALICWQVGAMCPSQAAEVKKKKGETPDVLTGHFRRATKNFYNTS